MSERSLSRRIIVRPSGNVELSLTREECWDLLQICHEAVMQAGGAANAPEAWRRCLRDLQAISAALDELRDRGTGR